VVFRFVDIGGIVDHHRLNSLFITRYSAYSISLNHVTEMYM